MLLGLGTDGVSAAGNLNLMRKIYLVAGMFKDCRMDSDAHRGQEGAAHGDHRRRQGDRLGR